MMWPLCKGRHLKAFVLSILAVTVFLTTPGRASLRKAQVGDIMPEFSLSDSTGAAFSYRHGSGKVVVLTFLPTIQSRFERVIEDIKAVAGNIPDQANNLTFAGIISGSAGEDLLKSRQADSKLPFAILLDSEFHLWGTLGVIAAPTMLIIGKDDKILWVRAGEGTDFVPVVRAYLDKALGIVQETAPENTQYVKAATNDTVEDRQQRHLQMAKILEQKGRIESAVAEVQKAAALDPNSIEPSLVLGELYCKSGRNKEALELTQKIKVIKPTDRARLLLISGWARRQMGELQVAEKLLLEATVLDPQSARALFELGKVYQAENQTNKAMDSYFKALTLVFNGPGEVKVSN